MRRNNAMKGVLSGALQGRRGGRRRAAAGSSGMARGCDPLFKLLASRMLQEADKEKQGEESLLATQHAQGVKTHLSTRAACGGRGQRMLHRERAEDSNQRQGWQ